MAIPMVSIPRNVTSWKISSISRPISGSRRHKTQQCASERAEVSVESSYYNYSWWYIPPDVGYPIFPTITNRYGIPQDQKQAPKKAKP